MFLFFLALFKPLPSHQLVNTGAIQIEKRVQNFISRRQAVKVRCCLLNGSWGQFSNLHDCYGSTGQDSPSSENRSSLPVAQKRAKDHQTVFH